MTDSNYVPHFGALLQSIAAYQGDEEIIVHVIHDGVPQETIDIVDASVRKIALRWYSGDDHPALSLPPLLHISRATYLRLMIDDVIDPAIPRVIYVDIDVIVTGSLLSLCGISLDGKSCGAVIDPGVDGEAFAKIHALEGSGAYFNAGMIVLDMQRMRARGILKKAMRLLLEGERAFEYADQDALNVVLWNDWKSLDPTWNFQRAFLYDPSRFKALSQDGASAPRLIHFTNQNKPWRSDEWHPYAWLYWKALLRSPFARSVMRKEGIGPLRLFKWWAKYRLNRPRLY